MEERALVRQFVEPPGDGPSLGERLGFGRVGWGWKRLSLVLILGFLFSVGTMPMGVYAVGLGGMEAALAFAVQVTISYAVLVGLVLVVGLWGEERRWESLGFRPLDVRSLAGVLAALGGIIVGVNLLGGLLVDLPHPRNIFIFGRHPQEIALTAFMVLILAPLAEEIFFRGFLLQGLVRYIRFWPAAAVSSGIFALAHTSFALMPPIFVLGLAFSWLFWRTGSLWAPIAAHATINGSSLLVLLLVS